MEQQSNYPVLNVPDDEKELYQHLDQLYAKTQKAKKHKKAVKHYGLLEIIKSPITIQTAVHNIKASHGADMPGTDGETMRGKCIFRLIRTANPEASGHHSGNIRTVFRKHTDTCRLI